MKIALVHDYLNEYGGAERVLLALHEIWPEAPIYTIYFKKSSPAGKVFSEAKIIESWFGKLPFCDRLISPFRFLIPLIWKSFSPRGGPWDFSQFDLVISSASWAVTKGFGAGKVKEICYCHTPPRYLYGYETSRNWKKHWWIRVYAAVVNHFMRLYDFQRAQRVDFFIANSREVASRIKKFYRKESKVISPPVDLPKFIIHNSKFDYFLTGGRLEAAKNFDLIIRAVNKLKMPLKIYGAGGQENYLRSIAGPTVEFLGRISDEEKFKLMADCRAFIVMAEDEDFGITPVEAMACGRPVIAYKGGGYLETVIEGKTGIFVDPPSHEASARQREATIESLGAKMQSFRASEFKPEDCQKQAEKFSKERFKKEMRVFVEKYA